LRFSKKKCHPNFRGKHKDERTQIGQTTACAATFETKGYAFRDPFFLFAFVPFCSEDAVGVTTRRVILRISEKKCHPKVSTFVLEMFREHNYGASWATRGLFCVFVFYLYDTPCCNANRFCRTKRNKREQKKSRKAYPFVSKVAAQAVVWPVCVLSTFCLSRKLGWHFFFEKRNR
jgi:hypothetical protein